MLRSLLASVFLLSLTLSPVAGYAQDEAALRASEPPPNALWVESLDLSNMTARESVRAARSTNNKPLTLSKIVYPHGIGTHVNSQMTIDLKGAATRFVSLVGVDDEVNKQGSVLFSVLVDGKTVAQTAAMKGGDAPQLLSVDLTGAHTLIMAAMTTLAPGSTWDIYNNGHADWAGAMLVLAPNAKERPTSVDFSLIPSPFKFPVIVPDGDAPAIHGPRLMGASPHRPFLSGVPATGKAPLNYTATGLPAGLNLDSQSGIISGQIEAPGTYKTQLTVSGPAGKATRSLTLECGDHKLALTPPMGWSAWNVFGETVTAARVKDQVDWLAKSGLAAHGYNYVLVDDTWQARRDADGSIGPNRRFGNLKALIDDVHARGLKFGLYSSPTVQTCSGYTGSAGHEAQDAALYANWGVDYLKYDWCDPATSKTTATDDVLKAAYSKMRGALDGVNRDIVYSINTYGFGKPWEWGAQVGANSWWTSGHILDRWPEMQHNGFEQQGLTPYAGPGHWNDLGWLMTGRLGFSTPRFTHLTPAEQMTQFSLWSLMSAPLLISCDLGHLDPNTLCPITTAVLFNDEVIEIDQDPLGQSAKRVAGVGDFEVWARPLFDGTKAVGLFNRKAWPQEIEIQWSDLGLIGAQPVRDLWQHRNLGTVTGSFKSLVPPHGVVLLKVG